MQKRPFVVIAQQSALPHYRIPFFRELANRCGDAYDFGVVFDPRQRERGVGFVEPVDPDQFGFRVLPTETSVVKVGSRRLIWQNIRSYVKDATLLITDSHLLNVSYPVNVLSRPAGCKWAVWGHVQNRNLGDAQSRKPLAKLAACLKQRYVSNADGILAYTPGEAQRARELGIKESKVHVVHNAVDTAEFRRLSEQFRGDRQELRARFGLGAGDRLFLAVGRLNAERRIDFLVKAFRLLEKQRPTLKLVVIGDGPARPETVGLPGNVKFVGAISDVRAVAEYYTAADALIAPGMVGLGVLPPLAFELPVMWFDLDYHSPEVEYLGTGNSIRVPEATTVLEFADYLATWENAAVTRWNPYRYESIRHLTTENMAAAFNEAVIKILHQPGPRG